LGNSFALIIAVEKYLDSQISAVAFAEADAQGFKEALKLHGFPEGNIDMLLSSSATKTTIESRFRRIVSNLNSEDQFILFYAGHGFAESDHNYVTCYDTQRGDLVRWTPSLGQDKGHVKIGPTSVHTMINVKGILKGQ